MRQPTLTYPEYLALERTSPEKHEYLRGAVWAMAGGTPSHARIASNILGALIAALKGRPCVVFNSDLRVRVEETDRSTYPDVTVVCREQLTARDDADAVVNPTLVIEVLSDSTEASDRGEKFAHLQRLSSLKEYVLVTQQERRVELFRRGEGMWTFHTFTTGRVELKSVDALLELDDVYADPLGAS
jgi:Uma2 family endonuclease